MVGASLLLGAVLLVPAFHSGFAPEPPSAAPALRFRGDFGLWWSITDGQGMADHALLTATLGPQLGPAGGKVGVAPLVVAGLGVAEGGEFSLRVGGGLEVALRVLPVLELVPSVVAGGLRQFHADVREGPFLKVGFGLRLLAEEGFFVQFEPVTLLLLPPAPRGVTRYGSKLAVDVAVVRIGGRTP